MKNVFLLFLFLLLFIIGLCHGNAVKNGKTIKYEAENVRVNGELPIYKSKDPQNLSPDGKSFTFIVHDSTTTVQMIQQMQSVMAKVVYDITSQYPNWIKTFYFLHFNSVTITQYGGTNDPNEFLTDFKEFATQNAYNTTERSCKNLPVFSSLYINLVTSPELYANSNIYVFMNGIIGDYSDGLYSAVRDLIIHSQTKVHFIQSNAYPCGEALTSEGPAMMWNISNFSGGETYVIAPPNVRQFLKTIPSHYQSSKITEAKFEDCSKEQIFKFSVDSQTQFVDILIDGEISQNPIYINPKGFSDATYVINAYSDYSTNENFDQLIGSCNSEDGYFVYKNGRCWGFNTDRQTWYQAKDYCNKHGGTLINILDNSDQKLLYEATGTVTFWNGLNDLKKDGKFVWDYNQNSSIPLSYKNWGRGEPNIDVGECVTDSVNNKWQVKNCNETNYSICARNYYNSTVDSSTSVFPGIWTLKVKTFDGPCSVKITTQSNIFVYSTFVTGKNDDIGNAAPISGTNYFVVAHVDGMMALNGTTKGELKSVTFRSGKTHFSLKMHLRNSQIFEHEYISDVFQCSPGNYQMTFTGVDSNGYDFTRIYPIFCYDNSKKF